MSAYDVAVLAASPVGYWKMNEASGNIADASGNGYTGTASGSPTYLQPSMLTGDPAKSIFFDHASAAFVNAVHPAYKGDITVMTWAKTNIPAVNQTKAVWLEAHANDATLNGWRCGLDNTNNYWFGTTGAQDYTFTATMTTGTAAHVTYVYVDATRNCSLYVNGVFSQTIGAASALIIPGVGLAIGKSRWAALFVPDPEWWGGNLQKLALFHAALSAGTISTIYAAAAVSSPRPGGGSVAAGAYLLDRKRRESR